MARSRRLQLEFANFVCRFGDKRELLDYASEIVMPAFKPGVARRYGYTSYLILDSQLVPLDRGEVGLVFEFVKNTKLERTQILDGGTLIQDEARIASAPSAQVLLMLSTHRLVFLPKTKHAPTLRELEATAKNLITAQRDIYIKNKIASLPRKTRSAARHELEAQIPKPTVDIVPLPSDLSISDAMVRFKTIEKFSVELIDPNSEFESDDFFKSLRAKRKSLGAKETKLVQGNKDGLDKKETEAEVRAAAKNGNAKVALNGKDYEDQSIEQKESDLKVTQSFDHQLSDIKTNAKRMFDSVNRLVANGVLSWPKVLNATKQKVARVLEESKKSE